MRRIAATASANSAAARQTRSLLNRRNRNRVGPGTPTAESDECEPKVPTAVDCILKVCSISMCKLRSSGPTILGCWTASAGSLLSFAVRRTIPVGLNNNAPVKVGRAASRLDPVAASVAPLLISAFSDDNEDIRKPVDQISIFSIIKGQSMVPPPQNLSCGLQWIVDTIRWPRKIVLRNQNSRVAPPRCILSLAAYMSHSCTTRHVR